MMFRGSSERWQRPARVASTAILLVALAAGCGADGAETSGDAMPAATPDRPTTSFDDPPVRSDDDRDAVAEVIDDVQEGLAMGVGASVCRELSGAAQERLSAGSGEPPRTCADAVDRAVASWRASGREPLISEIVRIEIEGDVALATLDVPGRGRRRVRVVRDSRWELPALQLEGPPGFRLLDAGP